MLRKLFSGTSSVESGTPAAGPSVRERPRHPKASPRHRTRLRPTVEALENLTLLSTITVNTILDVSDAKDEFKSLREAIVEANLTKEHHTIKFAPSLSGVIKLTKALPSFKDLDIEGPGSKNLTIRRESGGDYRIFEIVGGTMKLSGMTIANGYASGPFDEAHGGGLSNTNGYLTLADCAFTGNKADNFGGGVFTHAGTLTVIACDFSGNSATQGGGLYVLGIGTLNNCAFSNNTALDGGGIFNVGITTLTNCSISSNTATRHGGGLANYDTVKLTGCAITGNTATFGGGVETYGVSSTLANCTISGNTATNTGGGLFCSGPMTLTNCTFSDNTALGEFNPVGGIFRSGGVSLTMWNTIVANSWSDLAHTRPSLDLYAGSGAPLTGGNNLIMKADTLINMSAPVTGDPKLGPLQFNGGPTKTHALLAGSAAINAGDNSKAVGGDSNPLTADQRGAPFARVSSGKVDVGAYEAQSLKLVVDTTVDVVNGNYGPGDLSLREAVALANANPGADLITFNLAKGSTVSLTQGQALTITEAVVINGPGAADLTVNANNYGGIFVVSPGVTGVSIKGLTLTGGNASEGGAINNAGTLSVTDTVIDGNTAYNAGGAVFNTGTLTFTNCTLSNNSARRFPGDVKSRLSGGAILNVFGTLRLDNCTLSGNSATGYGGGLANVYLGKATLTNCTLSGNSAFSGGGILLDNGGGPPSSSQVTLTNCTLSGNSASGGDYQGGGIRSNSGTLTLNNTIVANSTSGLDLATGGTGRLQGSNNLIETDDTTGELSNPVTGDPRLGPLRDNGGPTRTMALLAGSPAINAGLNFDLKTDQRGAPFARVYGGKVDIGAYEVQRVKLVVDTNDSGVDGDYSVGKLGLREAIALANANPGTDLITFDMPKVGPLIYLTQGQALTITETVVINGPGAGALTIKSLNNPSDPRWSSIFDIDAAASGSGLVDIYGLTLTGGIADQGGAIRNAGLLRVSNTVIDNNIGTSGGGGVYNEGDLTLQNCTLKNNMAAGTVPGLSPASGGGIMSGAGGSVRLYNCVLSGNSTNGSGGGVAITSGTATISDCTLSDNGANVGGALFNGGTMTVSGTTIDRNRANKGGGIENTGTFRMSQSTVSNNTIYYSGSGGGIHNGVGGIAKLTNCTVAFNSAGSGKGALGGGFHNEGKATVTNCTIAFNRATIGGGLMNLGSLTMNNTIVAENVGYYDFYSQFSDGRVTGSNNLIMVVSPQLLPPGLKNPITESPRFDSRKLANNGGPTLTIALDFDSPAIDKGDNDLAVDGDGNKLTTDQRGGTWSRVWGPKGRVDIGAFEYQVK